MIRKFLWSVSFICVLGVSLLHLLNSPLHLAMLDLAGSSESTEGHHHHLEPQEDGCWQGLQRLPEAAGRVRASFGEVIRPDWLIFPPQVPPPKPA